jgi:hypothetical protein
MILSALFYRSPLLSLFKKLLPQIMVLQQCKASYLFAYSSTLKNYCPVYSTILPSKSDIDVFFKDVNEEASRVNLTKSAVRKTRIN